MGKPTGFLEVERADRGYEKPAARKKSWKEFTKPLPEPTLRAQASRCMDCGIPFCHEGCPVNNLIPDWNNLVYRDQWRQALVTLHSTNNFPEFTGRICGLLRYGIPDFKMEKGLIDRRVEQMAAEGVEFRTSVEIGVDIGIDALLAEYDALALTGGAELPRDLEVAGRELAGIHFAMDYLPQQNKRVAGDPEAVAAPQGTITAKGKHVVVIGGGDTGSDCIGTSNRQGAKSITQLEILPKPPNKENKALVWPDWPLKLRTSSSQEEGCQREWAVLTKRAIGRNGNVEKLECVRVEWMQGPDGRWAMQEVPSSGFELRADLVLLAMGFLGPRKAGMIDQAGIKLDPRGNIAANTFDYKTSAAKIFSAGDMRRGQSLVVWAIREGRQCARAIDEFLMGASLLPR